MPLTDEQKQRIAAFREHVEGRLSADARFGGCERSDREDLSTLASRWKVEEGVYYELTVRPFLPQVRAGIMTDDRWKSEDLEQKIEDSGDTMQEFVEMGFEAAGLDWIEPPVEHYRDQGKYFYFATPMDLKSLDQLADAGVRDKTLKMIEGYYAAFSGEAG